MEIKDKKQKIIEYIRETYKPIGIVLCGSRVSGQFSPTSDWDLYIFTNTEFQWGIDTFEGEVLDITIEKYPIAGDFTFETRYHPEQFMEIAFDATEGWLKDAARRTTEKYQNGPENVAENEYQRLKKVMARYIQKVESRKNVQGLSFYYLSIFYEIALRLWFQLQNKWPISPHEALPHIEKNDPHFAALLRDLSESRDIEVQLNAARTMHGLLFKR